MPSGIEEWWNNVVNGWQDFWQTIDDRFSDYSDQYFSSSHAIASTADPQAHQDYVDAVGSSGVEGLGVDDGSANDFSSDIDNALAGSSPSISQYVQENPDLSGEDYLRYMAEHSDEWAEKYIDYITEKQSIDDANAYTASREDTAYQRLVEDLKKSGLNPSMMYGSSASPQASGSAGLVKASEGANSRNISNYQKLKQLLIAYMALQLKSFSTSANSISGGLGLILRALA